MFFKSKFNKYTGLFYALILTGIIVVFYFSWIDSPRLSLTGLLPDFITKRTDSRRYENLRTGVPFIFLGLVIGLKLILKKASLRYWVLSFFCLTALVVVAELGQLFLPLRTFDLKDVFWGSIASFFTLLIVYTASILFKTK